MANKLTRRNFLLAAGTVGVMLGSTTVLGGCSIPLDPSYVKRKSTGISVGNSGGSLRFAMRYPFSFDPFYVRELSGIQIAGLLFDPLVSYDPRRGEMVAAAARSWTVSDDGMIFRFRLAKDRTFHNGEPVTAASFKYAWERICKPTPSNAGTGSISYSTSYLSVIAGAKAYIAGEAEEISGVRAVSDRFLEVILEAPHFEFLKTLGYPGLAPVPASEIEDKPDRFFYQPIGNGPFRLVEPWGADGATLRLERYEEYLGEAALLKSVEFVFFADDREGATQKNEGSSQEGELLKVASGAGALKKASSAEEKSYEALERGSVDVARLPLSELESARDIYGESLDGHTAMPGQQVVTGQCACTYFLWLNLANETLSDVRIRKAISYAIDREVLCKQVFADTARPAGDMIPSVITGSRGNAWKDIGFDPEKARKLLRQYREENPSNGVELYFPINDSTLPKAFYTTVHESLEAVGFVVRMKRPQNAEEYDAIRSGPAIMFSGWIADFLDMENFLAPLFAKDGVANDSGYDNPAFDEMIAKARGALNETLRISAYQRADDIVAEDMAVVPLFYPTLDIVSSDRVNDLYVAPDEIADLRKVWVTL